MTDENTEPEVQTDSDIQSLFNDEETSTQEQETVTEESEKSESEETESKGEQTEESGEAESKAEAETETEDKSEPPSEEKTKSVPYEALADERRKRQEYERRVKEYESRLQPQDDNLPDPYEDPQGYRQAIKNQVTMEMRTEALEQSRSRMLEKHGDEYLKLEQRFINMANSDPELLVRFQTHHDPAAFVFEKAAEAVESEKNALKDAVIEELRKEGRLKEESTEKEEDHKDEEAEKVRKSATTVSQLANSTGAGKNNVETVKLSENPEDMFDD